MLKAALMGYFSSGNRHSLLTFLIAGCGLAIPPCIWAQSPASAGAAPVVSAAMPAASGAARSKSTTSPAIPAKAGSSGPRWNELSPLQQQALQPLESSWDANISEAQKRKWLEVSKSYPSLPTDGQAKLHSRMNEWVGLSARERAEARLNFAKTNELSRQLTSDQKKEKWATYQALSPDEKAKLAARATPKPAGAATAIKPVPAQKLASVPPHNVGKGESGALAPKIDLVPSSGSAKPGSPVPAPTAPTN